jgi:hypothetical protein
MCCRQRNAFAVLVVCLQVLCRKCGEELGGMGSRNCLPLKL